MNETRDRIDLPGRTAWCMAWALLLFAASIGMAPGAHADPAFAIERISTELEQGVYYVNADFRIELNQRADEALDNGVALTFVIQIHIQHHRLWLWNSVDANLTERYRLRYYPLTERYRVANLNSSAQQSYATLSKALSAISRVRHLPVIDATLLDADTAYYVAMRMVLDTKQLPGPLKIMARIVPGWQLSSNWREVRLKP
ncbi:MAG: DUF4390 domain-containing protein [Gammaproteobacteria bacterium]|nr:DUF4390 domain-containing protein [Gammaproteobacteria bacterium]